jgi:hypothetical protein
MAVGPTVFLDALSGRMMPRLVAAVICDRAHAGHADFAVSYAAVGDLMGSLLEETFEVARADRLGLHHARNVERLVFNAVANVAAHFGGRHAGCEPVFFWRDALNRAGAILVDFVGSVRAFLPVATCGPSWSNAHVLMYVLEHINGTVLYNNSRHVHSIAFLMLCDRLFGFVLDERRAHPEAALTDLSTSFGWCASSAVWRYVMKMASNAPFARWTPNCAAFASEIRPVQPASPPRPLTPECGNVANGRKRAIYESPSGDCKKARLRSESQNPLRLDF